MRRSSLPFVAAAVLAALASTPASAQERHERRRSEPEARSEGRAREGRAVPRAEPRRDERAIAPRQNRGYEARPYVARPYTARPYYGGSYRARPYYSRPYAVRPYYGRPYVFRPRVRLGFGVIVGYPVPYAYAYPYPVPVYGYAAPSAPVIVGPTSTMYGGVSLEISPADADVYVDGQYAGRVEEFDGTEQTLTLNAGRHRIDISAPGYEPMTFDVDVAPGQIVP
jgi:hypothetical protein